MRSRYSLKTCLWTNRSSRSLEAFGLLETLVATLILSVVFASLFSAIRAGARAVRTAQEQERARQVLVGKTEQLRMAFWTAVTNGSLPTNFSTLLYEDVTNSPSMNGTVTFQPSPYTDVYASNLYKVSISLSWTSNGQSKTSSVETLIAKDGIWSLGTP